MEILHLMKGDILFKEGDEYTGLYRIIEGDLEVYRIREGEEIQLSVMKPGELVGTVALFSKSRRSAHVRALTNVKLEFFPTRKLDELFSVSPQWILLIMKELINRLEILNQNFVQVSLLSGKNEEKLITFRRLSISFARFLAQKFRQQTKMVDGIPLCVLENYEAECEYLFLARGENFEKIFHVFLKGALFELDPSSKKSRPIVRKPNAERLESYAIAAVAFLKKKKRAQFIPPKYHSFLYSLGHYQKKIPENTPIVLTQFSQFYEQEFKKAFPTEYLIELKNLNILKLQSQSLIDVIEWDRKEVLKRVRFEQIWLELEELDQDDLLL